MLRHLRLTAHADISESLRARWFLVYSLVFGGIVVALFITGLTESRIMGFTGLSRLLITYLQVFHDHPWLAVAAGTGAGLVINFTIARNILYRSPAATGS